MISITISKKEYLRLYESSLKLQVLEEAGVDNWEGYTDADWEAVEDGMLAEAGRING